MSRTLVTILHTILISVISVIAGQLANAWVPVNLILELSTLGVAVILASSILATTSKVAEHSDSLSPLERAELTEKTAKIYFVTTFSVVAGTLICVFIAIVASAGLYKLAQWLF